MISVLANQIVLDEHNASGWYATKVASPGIVVPKYKTNIEHWLHLSFNTRNDLF